MGLFGSNKNQNPGPTPPPVSNANKYTVENVHGLLNEIGLMRLSVIDTQVKLRVSTIAWETPRYMARESGGGTPAGRIVAELQEALQMIKNVLLKYVDIQNNFDAYAVKGNALEAMDGAAASLQAFALRMEDTSSAGGASDLMGFNVDIKVLSTYFN